VQGQIHTRTTVASPSRPCSTADCQQPRVQAWGGVVGLAARLNPPHRHGRSADPAPEENEAGQ
jgi:hypothetical protein